MKNAVTDFGLVGDDSTNNDTAIASMITAINSSGESVFFPRGIYRFNSVWPDITGDNLILYGEGKGTGGYPGPSSSSYGTVFRHNGTSGDSITLNGTRNVQIKDILFWPVKHKTSGFEIKVGNRSTDTFIEKCDFWYPYSAVDANTAVFVNIKDCYIFDPFSHSIRAIGANTDGQHLEGLYLNNVISYNSGPAGSEPEFGSSWQGWAASTAYTVGTCIAVNSYIFQCVYAGTSASSGSGPTLPSYTNSTDRTTVYVTDGTARWIWLGTMNVAGLLIDSCSYHVDVMNCKFLTSWNAVRITDSINAAGSISKYIHLHNLESDHCYQDVIYIAAGEIITIDKCQLEASPVGRGIYIYSTCKGVVDISGNYIYAMSAEGIKVESGPKYISIRGNKIGGNGKYSSNTLSGINIGASTTDFQIVYNRCGPVYDSGGTQKYGIEIATGANNYVVTGNNTLGNGTGGILNTPGTSATKVVTNNI